MTTYAESFTAKLADLLGPEFEVDDLGHDLFAAYFTGTTGMLSAHIPNRIDKRKGVKRSDVTGWIETAMRTVRGHIPHYTETAAKDAREMLAAIPADL